MLEFLVVLGLVWIIFAIVQDFRNREIANWLNFSLLLFALVYRLFFSIFSNNYMFLVFGLTGLAVFFVIGHLFYYGRLFAGGDAKMFIALGAVIPFASNFFDNNLIFFVFIFTLLFGGALYSLAYSFVLAFMNKEKFMKEFKIRFKNNISYFYAVLAFSFVFILYVIITSQKILLFFPIFALGLFFVYIFAKSVEQSAMYIYLPASKLTIGDWLGEEIKIKDKIIKPYWEGLSEEDIKFLKKHHKKKILIKQGIPFTPAFLIAFLTIIYIQYFQGGDFGLYRFFGF